MRREPGDPLPYWLMRLLWIRQAIGEVPWRARLRWLLNALTYRCEICFECGRRVSRRTGSWYADDALWLRVVGRPHGILCEGCFTRAATAKGICVRWQPVPEGGDK